MFVEIACLIPLRFRLVRNRSTIDLQIEDMGERINMVGVFIQKEKQAIESFRKKIDNFSKLKDVTEQLSMCLTLEDTSRTLSDEVGKLYGQKDRTIILYLFHSKTGRLGISSSQKGQMRVNIKSKNGDEFDQWVVKTMQSLLIEDAKNDYRFDVDKIKTEDDRKVRSLITVPMTVGNKALGILRVDSPLEDQFDTEDLRFLTTIGDVGALAVENAQLYEHVQQLAIRDGLTNLYLRRYLLERMPNEISRALRNQTELSFVMIDIDKFKRYNDKFGHMAGDIVLKTVGMLMSEFFQYPGNLVCRYGGEEFCVLLPDCSKKKVAELAEEFRHLVEKKIVVLRREKTHITVSMGVASLPTDTQHYEELIGKADQALYQAKETGRNKVCVAKS